MATTYPTHTHDHAAHGKAPRDYMPEPAPRSPKKGGCGCKGNGGGSGCSGKGDGTTDTCCELTCFTRPNYFCGHLLTDADLSLAQRYDIEKNKLRNRTLHGDGVVCGLRLTCDHACPGHVRIGEGYAIDECGHDLVVCEPASFDVIGRLREKGYLVDAVPMDPCKPKEEQEECQVRQCFHIVACYKETPAEFTTPFTPSCSPALTNCEPTRILEGVTFDVVADPPALTGWRKKLADLACRFQACAKLFAEGPFAQLFKDKIADIQKAVNGQATTPEHKKFFDLFCQLRSFLLLYLKKHPDHYNCTIEEEIRHIPFPTEQEQGPYATLVQDAYCNLIEQAYRHVVDCKLGETIFSCAEPPAAACVRLGTVEVEGGRVVKVCNCPREYVWSFASFFDVLVATFIGGKACEDDASFIGVRPGVRDPAFAAHPGHMPPGVPDDPHPKPRTPEKEVCCREVELDCQKFVRDFATNPKAVFQNSLAFFQAIGSVLYSTQHAVDFTRNDVLPQRLFHGMKVEEAMRTARARDIPLEIVDQPLAPRVLEPLEAIVTAGLKTAEMPVVAYQSQGVIVDAHPVAYALGRPPERDPALDKVEALAAEVEKKNAELADLKKNVGTIEAKLRWAEEAIAKLGQKPPDETGGKRGRGSRA